MLRQTSFRCLLHSTSLIGSPIDFFIDTLNESFSLVLSLASLITGSHWLHWEHNEPPERGWTNSQRNFKMKKDLFYTHRKQRGEIQKMTEMSIMFGLSGSRAAVLVSWTASWKTPWKACRVGIPNFRPAKSKQANRFYAPLLTERWTQRNSKEPLRRSRVALIDESDW